MKVYRMEEAAQRLGLSIRVLETLEGEGRIEPYEKISGVSYYSQTSLDELIQELNTSIQRASWRDIEARMEDVEERLENMEKELKSLRDQGSRVF